MSGMQKAAEFKPLTNRSATADTTGPRFKLPDDGFVQVVPKGAAPNELADGTPIIQLVDDEALTAMFNRAIAQGGEVLIDYEHFSHESDKATDAAAWLPLEKDTLQIRDDGLYGKPRWSDDGEKAVTGGRLRHISPEFPQDSALLVNVSGKVYRPLAVTGFGLTNRPGFRRHAKPLSNSDRSNKPGANPQQDDMHKSILALALGLAETELDKLDEPTLRNRAQALKDNAAKAATLEAANKARQEKEADDFMKTNEAVLKNRSQKVRDTVRSQFLADADLAKELVAGMSASDTTQHRAGYKPLHNREQTDQPKPEDKRAEALAQKRSAHANSLRNRDKGISWAAAWEEAVQAYPDE